MSYSFIWKNEEEIYNHAIQFEKMQRKHSTLQKGKTFLGVKTAHNAFDETQIIQDEDKSISGGTLNQLVYHLLHAQSNILFVLIGRRTFQHYFLVYLHVIHKCVESFPLFANAI
jgi:hypothetical protein